MALGGGVGVRGCPQSEPYQSPRFSPQVKLGTRPLRVGGGGGGRPPPPQSEPYHSPRFSPQVKLGTWNMDGCLSTRSYPGCPWPLPSSVQPWTSLSEPRLLCP